MVLPAPRLLLSVRHSIRDQSRFQLEKPARTLLRSSAGWRITPSADPPPVLDFSSAQSALGSSGKGDLR